MYKIIKNTENGKYFTGSYRDGFWSIDIEDADLFANEESINYTIKRLTEGLDHPFENIKFLSIETIYKL